MLNFHLKIAKLNLFLFENVILLKINGFRSLFECGFGNYKQLAKEFEFKNENYHSIRNASVFFLSISLNSKDFCARSIDSKPINATR